MAKGSQGVRDAFGYLLEKELPALKRVIAGLPPNSVCVNIGAGSGTSGLAFLEGITVGTLYTVDIQDKASPFGGLENELIVMKESGFEGDPRYHQIHGDSAFIGQKWTGEPIDMVFIDGEHSYEQCSADIKAWLPHIKEGGIISLHDYLADVWPGVERAVGELLLNRYKIVQYIQTFIAFRV